jgi:hypothetical protein
MWKFRMLTLASAAAVISCSDGPAAPSSRLPVSPDPPGVQSDPLSPIRNVTLTLTGRGTITDWRVQTPAGEQRTLGTVIEAAPRAIITGYPVDTLLDIAFSGVPALGDLALAPPTVTIRDVSPGIPIVFLENSPHRLELLIFTRFSGFPARQFIQVEPAALDVTEYVAPDLLGSNGLLKGRIEFLAEEFYREWAPDGSITIHKVAGKTRITAQFTVQMNHRVRKVDHAPGF